MFDVVLLVFEQFRGVVVDGDGSDFIADPVEFASTLARVVFAGDFFDDIEAVGDLSEDRVAVVEEWSGGGGDEELGAVGSRTGVRHGENPRSAVAEIRMEFIGKLVTRTAASAFGWITTLEHEAFDHTMECHAIVITALGKIEKVRASHGGFRGVKGRVDVACGGVECDFDVVHDGYIKEPDAAMLGKFFRSSKPYFVIRAK